MVYVFLLMALAGILLGGAWSLRQQGRPVWAQAVTAALAVGALWGAWYLLQGAS